MKLEVHPCYKANAAVYRCYQNWLDSSPSALGEYLRSTTLEQTPEGAKYFQERLRFLDTDNDIKFCLNVLYSDLVKEQPAWTGLDSDRGALLLKNIDASGTSAWKFTKQVIWQLLWAGFGAVEVEASRSQSETEAQRRESNERSFVRLYAPADVLNWETFDDDGPRKGNLKRVVLRNRVVVVEGKHYQLYKVVSINDAGVFEIALFKSRNTIDGITIDDGGIEVDEYQAAISGTLDTLPIVFFGYPESGPHEVVIREPIFDSTIVLNKQSAYDLCSRYQGFTQRIVSGLDNQQDVLTIAANVWAAVPGDNVTVHTVSPSDPIALWRDIQRLRARAKSKLLLQFNQMVNPESREVSSVDAKRADAETRKNYYNDITDEVEQGMTKVLNLLRQFEGTGLGEDVGISMARDFELTDSETAQQEESSLWAHASEMGEAGQLIKKQLLLAKVMQMEIVALKGQTEEAIREEIMQAIANQKFETGPITSRLQELMLERGMGSEETLLVE